MRIIDLDFYADKGGAIFLGYAGEHLSTVLNFHMPAELGNNDCVYVINFRKDGESSEVVSHLAFKTGSDTNIVEYYIPSTIMGDNNSTGVFQLVAYGMTKPTDDDKVVKYSILGRSTEFHYVIDKAITTDASNLPITLNEDAEITIKNLIEALKKVGEVQAALGNLDVLTNALNDFISNSSDLSDKISTNTTNISNLSTKVGSYSFDNLTKINGVIPSNLMDALRKISTALNSLDNNKINKADAIKYTSESVLNDCVEPGTIYRYEESVNGNENGLAIGVYTVIPSHIAEDGKLAQYIFSTTGAIYYRYRTVEKESGSYVYTTKQLVTRQEFSNLMNDVSSMNYNKTTSIDDTTLAENNRNKLYPTTGAVDDYIKELSKQGIIGQKDYIVSYSLPMRGSWTQIPGGYTLEIDTNLIPGYTFTNKTKIDIEPTVELYSTLERSFCTGLYAVTEENEGKITYKIVALNKTPNTLIDVQLKLSEVK